MDSATQDLVRQERLKLLLDEAKANVDSEAIARACYINITNARGPKDSPVADGLHVFASSWQAINSGIVGGNLSGGGAAFQDLHVVIDADGNLPNFLTGFATGAQIDTVTLSFLDQKSATIGTITLKNSYFSAVGTYFLKTKKNRPVVHLALSYQNITIKWDQAQGGYNVAKGAKL
jgi:type VI protein secretion system component Hcp